MEHIELFSHCSITDCWLGGLLARRSCANVSDKNRNLSDFDEQHNSAANIVEWRDTTRRFISTAKSMRRKCPTFICSIYEWWWWWRRYRFSGNILWILAISQKNYFPDPPSYEEAISSDPDDGTNYRPSYPVFRRTPSYTTESNV